MRSTIIFLIFCIFISCSKRTPEHHYIFDNANMLSKEQRDSIEQKLKSIENNTTNEVVLYTIDSLGSRGIDEFSLEVSREIGLGEIGINNGLLIFIAPKEKKLRMQITTGNEWIIPDTVSKTITDTIVKYFSRKEIFKGLYSGICLIENRLSSYDWQVHEIKLDEVINYDIGKIVCFNYDNKDGKTYKYPISMDKQFQSDFFIELNLDETRKVKLCYTKYMSEILTSFSTSGKIKVFARVKSKNPLQLNLLGTIKR